MHGWYEHKMLNETLQLRRTTDIIFATIDEFFPKPLAPFVSQPMDPMAASEPTGPCSCSWEYVDTKGTLQGPFDSNVMLIWHERKFLSKELKLKRTTDADFATIPEYFPAPKVPFLSQPVNPAAVARGGHSVAAKPQVETNGQGADPGAFLLGLLQAPGAAPRMPAVPDHWLPANPYQWQQDFTYPGLWQSGENWYDGAAGPRQQRQQQQRR